MCDDQVAVVGNLGILVTHELESKMLAQVCSKAKISGLIETRGLMLASISNPVAFG